MLVEPLARGVVEVGEIREGEDEAVHRLFEAARIFQEFRRAAAGVEQKLPEDPGVARSQRGLEGLLVALSLVDRFVHDSSLSYSCQSF